MWNKSELQSYKISISKICKIEKLVTMDEKFNLNN